MAGFLEIPPKTFTTLALLVGFFMLDALSANAQNTLGNFFMLVAQVLETSANQQIYLQGLGTPPSGTATPGSSADQETLAAQMAQLQQEVEALKALLAQQANGG